MWFWVGDWSAARHRAYTATGELPESRIGIPTASIYGIWSVAHLWQLKEIPSSGHPYAVGGRDSDRAFSSLWPRREAASLRLVGPRVARAGARSRSRRRLSEGGLKELFHNKCCHKFAALARLWQHLQMSRGSGHIERSIQSLIERMRTNEHSRTAVPINSWVIVGEVFRPRSLFMRDWHWQPTVAQRKAVARAMHSFVHKFPQFALLGGQGRKKLYLYDTTDPDSVLWAQMTLASKDHVPFMSVKGSQKA